MFEFMYAINNFINYNSFMFHYLKYQYKIKQNLIKPQHYTKHVCNSYAQKTSVISSLKAIQCFQNLKAYTFKLSYIL